MLRVPKKPRFHSLLSPFPLLFADLNCVSPIHQPSNTSRQNHRRKLPPVLTHNLQPLHLLRQNLLSAPKTSKRGTYLHPSPWGSLCRWLATVASEAATWWPAIVDCACEFPRVKDFTTGLPYCCFPTWYTRSPQPADIESAVKWASRQRDLNKPIFVHCAYG